MTDGPLLFVLQASAPLGEAVARALGTAPSPLEERTFEDGEHKARPLCSVRGGDAYVLQSLHGDSAQSVNDKLVRLLFVIGVLKDAGARRVTAVVPYLAYARKDRRTKPLDPVTSRYVAQLFEAAGVDCVVGLDVHNVAAYQNAFRCRTEHVEAAPLFVRHFAASLVPGPVVVVSPDAGGIKRADDFRSRLAHALDRPIGAAFVEKHRSEGVLRGEGFVGDVEGATAIVVDDLISGGTTMARAARACRAHGASAVHAVATHGIFAAASTGALAGTDIDSVVVTNSVALPPVAPPLVSKLVRIDVAGLLAEAIDALHHDRASTFADA